jgi:BMFP domain-containing protein YqiC
MQPGNKFFDDMGKLMTNAMGVAQGAKTEMETAEFDAIRAMAQKAREENMGLEARIAVLEAKLNT